MILVEEGEEEAVRVMDADEAVEVEVSACVPGVLLVDPNEKVDGCTAAPSRECGIPYGPDISWRAKGSCKGNGRAVYTEWFICVCKLSSVS